MLKVLKGKDDYLFLDNDTNRVMSQITGKIPLNDKIKASIKTTFERRMLYADYLGFQYLYLITPNAHCVHAEHLPDGIEISDDRSAIYLQKNFPDVVYYSLEVLRQYKDKYTVYYKTDTHWTGIGAALTFNEVSDRLGLNTKIDVDGIPKVEKEFVGDLGIKLTPNKKCTYQALDWESDVELLADNRMATGSKYLHLRSNNRNGKRCVIFGGSSVALYENWKIIGHYFAETFFFWVNHSFDRQIINELQPDVVVHLINERFFNGNFDSIPYATTLMERILSMKSYEKLEEIDLSDDFFSESLRKFLAAHKKHLLNEKAERLARDEKRIATVVDAVKKKYAADMKSVLEQNLERPIISYRTHLSVYGWLEKNFEGQISGLLHSRRAIEAIEISIPSELGVVKCTARTRKKGLLETVEANKIIGSIGKGDPILGIKLELDERSNDKFDVLYRIHSLSTGGGGRWSAWFFNGQEATVDDPFNAIQIRLRKK